MRVSGGKRSFWIGTKTIRARDDRALLFIIKTHRVRRLCFENIFLFYTVQLHGFVLLLLLWRGFFFQISFIKAENLRPVRAQTTSKT